jgi:light-regulated signal transduction histidine kinase (bacteriophytochrome)
MTVIVLENASRSAAGVRPPDVSSTPASPARLNGPFGQVHAASVRNQEGTGLGLAIVHALMQQHGGHAEIDSVLGAWTRVTLTFPAGRLAVADDDPPDADGLVQSAAG